MYQSLYLQIFLFVLPQTSTKLFITIWSFILQYVHVSFICIYWKNFLVIFIQASVKCFGRRTPASRRVWPPVSTRAVNTPFISNNIWSHIRTPLFLVSISLKLACSIFIAKLCFITVASLVVPVTAGGVVVMVTLMIVISELCALCWWSKKHSWGHPEFLVSYS